MKLRKMEMISSQEKKLCEVYPFTQHRFKKQGIIFRPSVTRNEKDQKLGDHASPGHGGPGHDATNGRLGLGSLRGAT